MRLLRHFWISYKGVSLWLNWKAYAAEKIINPIFRLLFYSTLLAYGYKTLHDARAFIIANIMALSSISVFKGLGIIFFLRARSGIVDFLRCFAFIEIQSNAKKDAFSHNRCTGHGDSGTGCFILLFKT
ncbi:hypothetical protein TM_1307 [Thermotoga maritima MSB8]|uniref:Uncharacterized protein n=1 Tax=Thermotoga maritima (strain ATCC 43589 / DSM 3109 / JCM 10099 / NBRC 100826 / MSB8) TaxID=243274 RepID=Q9X133_THEMA|nr:hypothetical protein TM_1307 [Thermotoga maritima MSB8]